VVNSKLGFVDLFAGCGGFSEGFMSEGYNPLLHVDFDLPCCETIKNRLCAIDKSSTIHEKVLNGDLTKKSTINEIINRTINSDVDILVGGPPCQSFSTVGRAQDPNSMCNDPRNYLFKSYLNILKVLRPKVFVFENVSGLLSAKPDGQLIFPLIIKLMSENYQICDQKDKILLNSVHYGVPQIRKRVILIGVRKDQKFSSEDIYGKIIKTHFSPEMESRGETEGLKKYLTVFDAINDLPKLAPDQGSEITKHIPQKINDYLNQIRDKKMDVIFNHKARKHNKQDMERYHLLSKHNWQLKDLVNVRPDLVHHDPKHFGNRYTVQSYDKPGRTVVAHLYKDGNLFIHPDSKQKRTFTVREAARIQSFPDDFQFVGARTNQYKQVGNAVPPLMAKSIASAIKDFLL
jgi:DNA (cytosine-5)-methyltransferase 1